MTTKKIYTVEFRFHLGDTYEIEAFDKEEARGIFEKRVEEQYPALCDGANGLECDTEWTIDDDE